MQLETLAYIHLGLIVSLSRLAGPRPDDPAVTTSCSALCLNIAVKTQSQARWCLKKAVLYILCIYAAIAILHVPLTFHQVPLWEQACTVNVKKQSSGKHNRRPHN